MAESEKEIYERLLRERAGGDAGKLAQKLLKLNLQAREEIADLEGKVRDLAASQLPKDHVAVPKADVDLLTEYKAIGEPKVIKAAVERVPVLENDIRTRDHESGLRDVSGKLGWQFDVLKRLAPVGVAFVPHKTKDDNGKDVYTFQVKDVGPDGKERTRSLDQWQDDPDVKPLLPALKPADAQRTSPSGRPVSASGGYEGTRNRGGREGEREEQPRYTGNVPVLNAAASI